MLSTNRAVHGSGLGRKRRLALLAETQHPFAGQHQDSRAGPCIASEAKPQYSPVSESTSSLHYCQDDDDEQILIILHSRDVRCVNFPSCVWFKIALDLAGGEGFDLSKFSLVGGNRRSVATLRETRIPCL